MNKLKPLNENSKDTNKYNIPLQHQVIDLRARMIPALFNFKPKKIISNINSEEIKIFKHFLTNKPFENLQCDKKVGSILINKIDVI
jgi:hypothetical protein